MQNERTFTFSDGHKIATVKIPETTDLSYGSFTWSCAPILAQYIWSNRHLVTGKTVLELGAGTALPGILAALCGARVILTDAEDDAQSLASCHQSAKVNGQLDKVTVLGLTWGRFPCSIFTIPPVDIILGSDCFYDNKDFDDILATVAFLLDQKPQSVFWTTYQVRCPDDSIEDLLLKWDLTASCIPLKDFAANGEEVAGCKLGSRHVVQMIEIRKKDDP